tara:strand:+ start:830 stop:1327 length:498 start_codon:yes stop_codon:yes gene_type:complete
LHALKRLVGFVVKIIVTGSVGCVQLVLAMVLVLCGLQSRPELNGHVVTVVEGKVGDERLKVKLEDGTVISVKSTSVKVLTNNVQVLLSESESESDESDTEKVHKLVPQAQPLVPQAQPLVPQAQALANIKADDVYKLSPMTMVNRWSVETSVVTRYDGDKSQFVN